MNFRYMKLLDRWVGTPACLALTLFRGLITPLRLLRRRPVEMRRIVLIKFFGLGSMLMTFPMLRALRARHPGATIHFVTFEENRAILAGSGLVDEVIGVRPRGLFRFAIRAAAVWLRLVRLQPEAVLDLEYFSRFSVMLAYLSFAPVRAGFWLPQVWRGALLTKKIYYNHFKHITDVYLALASAVGASPGPVEPPSLPVTAAAKAEAAGILESEGLAPGFVAVNPNASPLCLERRWPAPSFAALLDRILERGEARVALLGSPSERDYNESVRALCRDGSRIANLAGRTTLEGVTGVLEAAGLLVTNDSGLLHLATAVGTPVVALFGPETPGHYGPLGGRARIFYKGVYCSPCLNAYNTKTAPCRGNNICMQQIGVEEVWSAVEQSLREEVRT